MDRCLSCGQNATFYEEGSTTRLFCSKPCQLIEGKKREREDFGPCLNSSDVFTMEDFADIPSHEIITIGEYCYHLPHIFNWVINKEMSTNPYTNLNFSELEKRYIARMAKERFPLNVIITKSDGNGIYRQFLTTSLIKQKTLLWRVLRYNSVASINEDSLYKALLKWHTFDLILETDPGRSFIEFLTEREHGEQVYNWFSSTEIRFHSKYIGWDIGKVLLVRKIRNFILNSEVWPSDTIKQKLNTLVNRMNAFDKHTLSQILLREKFIAWKNGPRMSEPFPTIEINVHEYSNDGFFYSGFPYIVSQNATLKDLEEKIRAKFAVYDVKLPEKLYFRHKGKKYKGDTLVRDVNDDANLSVQWKQREQIQLSLFL